MIRHYKTILALVSIILSGLSVITAPLALLMGFGLRNLPGLSSIKPSSRLIKRLLQLAVIVLGLCIDVDRVAHAGTDSLIFIALSVLFVLLLGYATARLWKLEPNLRLLISSGTAICGGSAIASVAPVTNASNSDVSVSLGVVFVLNAVAIFIFPAIGFALEMTQTQFGLWCAVAIHDTSSVVGAAAVYGEEALELAASAKLARVLWIIPVVLFLSLFNKNRGRIRFPWFVLFFLAAICIARIYPISDAWISGIFQFSKGLLAIVLFLMGYTLSLAELKKIGHKPLLFGTTLWICIACISGLVVIRLF